MKYVSMVICLILAILGCNGSPVQLVPLVSEANAGSLYNNYNGAYAGKYDNYKPTYAYEYGVSDPHTGDHKSQWETKDKDGTVRGSYSLLEADGTTRIVDYIADEHGFRAVVKKVGIHGHPESIESHGNTDEAYPVASVVTHEPFAPQHALVETPVTFKSYDGGFDTYSGLEPVIDDVYAKPQIHLEAPNPKGILIAVPEDQEPHGYPTNAVAPEYNYATQGNHLLTGEYLEPKTEYASHGYEAPVPQYYNNPHVPQEHVVPQEHYVPQNPKYLAPQVGVSREHNVPQSPEYFAPQGGAYQEHYVPQAPQYFASHHEHTPEYFIQQGEYQHQAPSDQYQPIAKIPEYQPSNFVAQENHQQYLAPAQVPVSKINVGYGHENVYSTASPNYQNHKVLVETPNYAPEQHQPNFFNQYQPDVHSQYNSDVNYLEDNHNY